MKRLFYSTIAVLAFSVSGMANMIELEDLKIKSDVSNDKNIVHEGYSEKCFNRGINTYYQAIGAGFTEEQAINYMHISSALCEGWKMEDINL